MRIMRAVFAHQRDVSGDARVVDALAVRELSLVHAPASEAAPAWCGARLLDIRRSGHRFAPIVARWGQPAAGPLEARHLLARGG